MKLCISDLSGVSVLRHVKHHDIHSEQVFGHAVQSVNRKLYFLRTIMSRDEDLKWIVFFRTIAFFFLN